MWYFLFVYFGSMKFQVIRLISDLWFIPWVQNGCIRWNSKIQVAWKTMSQILGRMYGLAYIKI